jgi:HlyD family secretion protein
VTLGRWITALVLVGIVAAATVMSLRPRKEKPTEVQTTEVKRAPIVRTVRAAGKLDPRTRVNVSSNITGDLLELFVGSGEKVKRGQLLARIDARRYQAIVRQQEAAISAASSDVRLQEALLDKARQDLVRSERLLDTKAIGPAEVDRVKAEVKAAEARLAASRDRVEQARGLLDEARLNVSRANLYAPTDGTVIALNHRVGERVRGSDLAEDVVLTLGSLSRMDVRVDVGEHDVVHVKRDQDAEVEIDAFPERIFKGKVVDIARSATVKGAGTDAETTTFGVIVELANPPSGDAALPGMSASVGISADKRDDALVVPIQAVTVRALDGAGPGAGKEGVPQPPPTSSGTEVKKTERVVFVVEDGKAKRRPVKTGLTSETMVEIIEGLKEGEEVVEGPYRVLARELNDGAEVKVEEEDEKGGADGGEGKSGVRMRRGGRRSGGKGG